MEPQEKPSIELARKVLAPELLQCLEHVFAQNISGCLLAGGSSLSGFYSGHRKSDDLDFFVRDETSQKITILAIESLSKIKVTLETKHKTGQFFQAICQLNSYTFSLTSVVDRNLFQVGQFVELENKVCVVTLHTLLKMKCSTLISRCSEKDLYDLMWLFEHFPEVTIKQVVEYSSEMDGGATAETILLGITGSTLKKETCGFGIHPSQTAEKIFEQIVDFRKNLIRNLSLYLHNQPAPPLAALVKQLKKLI